MIGYIKYNINRSDNSCSGLCIYNFTDNKATFGMDLGHALQDIFDKFKFRKLTFCVAIGNPIEKSYDKMIKNTMEELLELGVRNLSAMTENIMIRNRMRY